MGFSTMSVEIDRFFLFLHSQDPIVQMADFIPPTIDHNHEPRQGQYRPKGRSNFHGDWKRHTMCDTKDLLWETEFDPLHVLLRISRRDLFETAMQRYTQWSEKRLNRTSTTILVGRKQLIDGMAREICGHPTDCLEQRINCKQIYVVFCRVVIFMGSFSPYAYGRWTMKTTIFTKIFSPC